MHFHWQNLTDERKQRTKTWPYHGRAWLHPDSGAVDSFCFSWNLWSRFCGVSFFASSDREDSLAVSLAFPPFAFWFTIDARSWLLRFVTWIVALQPSDMGNKWSGRELSIRVHDWAIWWSVWVDDSGWTSSRSKWRDGCFHLLGHNCRQGDVEEILTRMDYIQMPERKYECKVTLERVRFGWDRLPRFFDKIITRGHVDMLDGEHIPFPGKGTCSHNCDADAMYSWNGLVDSIPDALEKAAASVTCDRKRYPL